MTKNSIICIWFFSTLSSSLNSMAAVVWEDVLKVRCSHLQESRKTFITKTIGEAFFFFMFLRFWILLENFNNNLNICVFVYHGAFFILAFLAFFVIGFLLYWVAVHTHSTNRLTNFVYELCHVYIFTQIVHRPLRRYPFWAVPMTTCKDENKVWPDTVEYHLESRAIFVITQPTLYSQ